MIELSTTTRNGRAIYYRSGSSDWDAIAEVLSDECYLAPGFAVYSGERWLDLGANIGAFSVFCELKGATVVAYEPDQECYDVLYKNVLNPESRCIRAAVTANDESMLPFYVSSKDQNHWRGTVLPTGGFIPAGHCRNVCGANIMDQVFTGVKMDIEGAEHEILDAWMLPKCDKLVLEYHTSRDPSIKSLALRLKMIRERFKYVIVPSMYDTAVRHGKLESYHPTYDGTIWAWN